METQEILAKLKIFADCSQKNLEGMARFGINVENTLCVSMPNITKVAKEILKKVQSLSSTRLGNDEMRHGLALELWNEKYREAKLLAAIIDVPELVTEEQMESWVKDFDSWDICDNTIIKSWSYSPLGWKKAIEWSKREEEFVKRAGFVLMACLPIHDKKAPDENFLPFFERIKEEATDERNFVKKAVNWALRQIGKSRTKYLYNLALETAKEIAKIDNKTAKWIAKDAIRELENEKIKRRFKNA